MTSKESKVKAENLLKKYLMARVRCCKEEGDKKEEALNECNALDREIIDRLALSFEEEELLKDTPSFIDLFDMFSVTK